MPLAFKERQSASGACGFEMPIKKAKLLTTAGVTTHIHQARRPHLQMDAHIDSEAET